MDIRVIKYVMFVFLILLLLRLFVGKDIFDSATPVSNATNESNIENTKEILKEDKTQDETKVIIHPKKELLQRIIKENEDAEAKLDPYPDMYVEGVKPIILLEEKKMAYLTFDDGPSINTAKILEVLKENNIKATFFIFGSTITEEGKESLKRMAEEGHEIGIHTYSHNSKYIYSSVEAFLADFNKAFELVYDITGIKPTIFRFPYGSVNSYNKAVRSDIIKEMSERGFTYYDWNIDSKDSIGMPSGYIINQNIVKELSKYNNPIILLHDSCVNKETSKTLPVIIKDLKEEGFDFDTLNHREPFHF